MTSPKKETSLPDAGYFIQCTWDPEAEVWYSESEQIPITLESPSLDNLIQRIRIAIPELAELNGLPQPKTLYFTTNTRVEACI